MTPTNKQIADAYLTLKAAGIYPLLCISVEDVKNTIGDEFTEGQINDALGRMSRYYDMTGEFEAAVEYVIEECRGE
jgi:hypothetical protein